MSSSYLFTKIVASIMDVHIYLYIFPIIFWRPRNAVFLMRASYATNTFQMFPSPHWSNENSISLKNNKRGGAKPGGVSWVLPGGIFFFSKRGCQEVLPYVGQCRCAISSRPYCHKFGLTLTSKLRYLSICPKCQYTSCSN